MIDFGGLFQLHPKNKPPESTGGLMTGYTCIGKVKVKQFGQEADK
jgi:hypothetical protein